MLRQTGVKIDQFKSLQNQVLVVVGFELSPKMEKTIVSVFGIMEMLAAIGGHLFIIVIAVSPFGFFFSSLSYYSKLVEANFMMQNRNS